MYVDRFLAGFILGVIVGIVAVVGIAMVAAKRGGDEDGKGSK